MIQMERCGAEELNGKIAEIERLGKSEEVRTAELMERVSRMLDIKLRDMRKKFREGEDLIAGGTTAAGLNEILRTMGGAYDA